MGALVLAVVGAAGCDGRPLLSPDGGPDGPLADAPAEDRPADSDRPPADASDAGDRGETSNPLVCHYNGLTYSAEFVFLSSDGCNACRCAFGGQVTCDQKTCPLAGVTCTIDGTTYLAGAPIPSARLSDCDTCACTSAGYVACRQRYCSSGQCVFGFDDTCNEDPTVRTARGTCQADGTCACGSNPVNPGTGHCLAPGHDVQSGCELGGVIHPDGSTFPCADGCNSCGCQGREVYVAANMTCGAPTCSLDEVIVFEYVTRDDGQQHRVTLTPGSTGSPGVTYVHTRTDQSGATASCSPALPSCGDPALADLADIATDLRDPITRELLANPGPQAILLGGGPPELSVRRGVGPGILIGTGCDGRASACNAVPPGVARLAYDLRQLDDERIAKSRSCEVLAPPTFACGATTCNSRTQYCASVQVNGAHKLDVCRPYPSGCDTCGCARDDALPAMRQVYPGCDTSFTYCYSGSRTLDPGDLSATLVVACTEG